MQDAGKEKPFPTEAMCTGNAETGLQRLVGNEEFGGVAPCLIP